MKRFVSIWFRYLLTDWFLLRHPNLTGKAFVLSTPSHGKIIVTAANALAAKEGIYIGMAVADARAIIPDLEVLDHRPITDRLLKQIAEWCIRFTPVAAIDPPNGIVLEVTGCSHLWGGDEKYLQEISKRITDKGYDVKIAIADTIGVAWAAARFSRNSLIIEPGNTIEAIQELPVEGLRLEIENIELLRKLGLTQIKDLVNKPKPALRRRFGPQIVERIEQALGEEEEFIDSVVPIEPYQERLPCMDAIVTATGIEIAIKRLLSLLCARLIREQKGLRQATFNCYRVDGKIEQVEIATIGPSNNAAHIFNLFSIKLATIEPALGIELFVLTAAKVEDHTSAQQNLWETTCGVDSTVLAELVDRLAGKVGANSIIRYLPAAHYWPEYSYKKALHLKETISAQWKLDKPRPMQLLETAERIEVTAPVPDYPPMLFRYKGKLHKIAKADGPERIEQEWWQQEGEHRDYYTVEDENGCRYWLYRSGHYNNEKPAAWYIHGFFA